MVKGWRLGGLLIADDIFDRGLDGAICSKCDAVLLDPDDFITGDFGDVCCAFCGAENIVVYDRYNHPTNVNAHLNWRFFL